MNDELIFTEALAIASPIERAAFLDRVCAQDAERRKRIEGLLQAHENPDSFLNATHASAEGTRDVSTLERPGTVIGPYKLLQQIGEGGMGTVYMAEQTHPVQRKVALKIIKAGMDSKQVIARFEAERQALALMEHPNIAKVFDAGTTSGEPGGVSPGRPYFVMELVRGESITKYCDEHRLTPRQRLELFLPVCQAIQHAHQKGIIHRDIKASNVLIAPYDGKPVVKVIDFGIAKATGQQLTEKTLFTDFGAVVGTLEYMSPEQAELNNQDIDTRSDIYSLGVLLYELLTGTTPLDRARLKQTPFAEMLRIIREDEPPKPSTRLSDSKDSLPSISAQRQMEPVKLTKLVRGELDWIVMKALDKDRNRRYETANGFAIDVQRYLTDEPVQACPPSAAYRLRKFARRNRTRLAVAGLVFASCLFAVGSLAIIQLQNASRIRELTQNVRESFTGARTAIQAGDLTLATQQLAEAQGRLSSDRTVLPELAAEYDRIHQEIEARRADEARFQQFLKVSSDEQDKMYGLLGGREDHRAEKSLEIYGVLAADDWPSRLENSYLTAEKKQQVREAAYVTLVSLADEGVRWQGKRDDPKSVQRSLDLLNRAKSFHEPTRAFYFVRAECHKRQGNAAAADEDNKLYRQMEGQTAWDYFLPGHTAGWSGDLAEAIRSYQAALRVQPNHYNSLFFMAMRFDTEKINRRPEAIQLFTACIALRPDHWYARHCRADCYKKMGQMAEVAADLNCTIAACKKALQIDPGSAAAYRALGIALNQKGKTDDALAAYQEALRLQPELAENHCNLGLALQGKGMWEEAFAAYQKALSLKPSLWEAHFNLGGVYLKKQQPDLAIVAYREAIKLKPNYALVHFNLAQILLKKGQLDEAITEYKEAIKYGHDDVRAHNNLGVTLSKKGLNEEAIIAFREAIKIDPTYAPAHNSLGYRLFEKGLWEEAIVPLREAIKLDPKGAIAYHNLGAALGKQGKWDEAIGAFKKAVELNPTNATAYSNLGSALREKGKLDDAIGAYRKAVELNPTFAGAYSNLGLALRKKGEVDEAIAAYRKVIKLDPTFAAAHAGLGEALRSKQQLEEAIAECRKAVRLDPKAAGPLNTLGLALEEIGRLDEAIAAFKEAIRLKPDFADAYSNLGTALNTKGKSDEAIAACREAVRLNPKDFRYHCNLGVVYYGKRQIDEAIAALRESVALNKKFPNAHVLLGLALAEKGDYDQALATQKKAIQLASNNPALAQKIASQLKWVEQRQSVQKQIEKLRKAGQTQEFKGELTKTTPLLQGKHFKAYSLPLQAGKQYLIDLKSTDFDAYLLVKNPGGKVVAEDDDGGGFTDSRILFAPKTDGLHEIIVQAFGPGQTGNYTLRIQAYQAADAGK